MMNLTIHKPFKYLNVTQKWNNPNDAYAQFGFTHHNGVDLTCGYANQASVYNPKTWPVYCPVEGFVVQKVQYMPQGGGNELWMLSKEKLQIGDKLCYAYLVMCHAEKIFAKVGNEPVIGDMLMVADSTGFSTGPHVHMGLYRVDWDGIRMTYLDQNDANGSHDAALYFTDDYAVDLASASTLIKSAFRYYQYLISK